MFVLSWQRGFYLPNLFAEGKIDYRFLCIYIFDVIAPESIAIFGPCSRAIARRRVESAKEAVQKLHAFFDVLH